MPAWTVDDSVQRQKYDKNKHIPVPAAAMEKYFEWRRKITQENLHPKEAAKKVGDTHYEPLNGEHKGEFTIRINQEHRVAFTIDDDKKTVNVFVVGGHYPPSKK